jgi:predicted amidohydrolase
MPAGAPGTVRAAAVQLQAVVGDVAENLRRVEGLVDEAAARGASLIAVPEFFTSPVPFRPEVHGAVLPPDNRALALLQDLAARHRCTLGGSVLVADGDRVTNRYHLVEPSGRVHIHDKDLPTMWENAFYGPGDQESAFDAALGRVGVAVCWELIRTQTVRRMLGRVDVAVTGTHWWTLPSNWGRLTERALASIGERNRRLSEEAPAELARRLGVPVLQASHCGPITSHFMLVPGVPVAPRYDTHFVGATQVVDAEGRMLAQRNTREGPGVVVADIHLGARAPLVPLEERFWIPRLPPLLRAYWHHQNACAKAYYARHGRAAGLRAAHAAARADGAPAEGELPQVRN